MGENALQDIEQKVLKNWEKVQASWERMHFKTTLFLPINYNSFYKT